jgi:hypothetical protein
MIKGIEGLIFNHTALIIDSGLRELVKLKNLEGLSLI